MRIFPKTIFVLILLSVMFMLPGMGRGHSLGYLESILFGGNHLFIGVTLHPYYSFVRNITGDAANVIPITGGGFHIHGKYTPKAEEIKRLMTIDILVMNELGHDDFIYDGLKAARVGANDIIIIRPVTETPVLQMAGAWYERERIKIENPHTFISIESSIQQIEYISKKLKMLDSENRDIYDENTERYIKRLEGIKAMYAERISGIETRGFRCAATQASFAYFLQEFGVRTMLIVEPKHGVRPTDIDVHGSILKMKEYNIKVLFSGFGEKNGALKKICDATGARSYPLTHMTGGEYTSDKFEQDIIYNLESLTRALIDNQEQGGATDKM